MIRTQLLLLIIDMLEILEKDKPRTMRIQRNPSSGQWSVGIPVEVVEGAQLEKWDTVKFTVQDRGRILLEVLR